MGKSKKIPMPSELQVEAIVWEDHSGGDNGPIKYEVPMWTSVGFRILEDDKKVVLVSTISDDDAENLNDTSQPTWVQILKSCIVTRKVLATTAYPIEP